MTMKRPDPQAAARLDLSDPADRLAAIKAAAAKNRGKSPQKPTKGQTK
jgi:hypothetical protein